MSQHWGIAQEKLEVSEIKCWTCLWSSVVYIESSEFLWKEIQGASVPCKQPVRNYCLQNWSFSSLEVVQKWVSEERQSFKNGASQENISGAADL